jgi:hypothetical protein
MTTAHRAFLGAILGAIIALFLHPLSRPWLKYSFWHFAPSQVVSSSPHLAKTLPKLPSPDNDEDLSLYVQLAAEKISDGQSLSEKDALLLAELCRNAAEKDPQNAYWRQSEAVFQYALGNTVAAKTAWSRASKRPNWNDFQSQQIKTFLSDMGKESGAEMSWHSAVAAYLRSTATAKVIYSLGIKMLNEDPSLQCRSETFINAILIRDQSRTESSSKYGYDLAEIAASGPFTSPGSKRDKSFIRAEFPTELNKVNLTVQANQVDKGLRENEAFQALVFTTDAETHLRKLTGQSILLASVPGAFLFASACAALLLLLAYCIPLHRLGDPVKPIVPTVLALILAVSFYGITRNIIMSLWILLVTALFAIHPPISLISPTLKIPRLSLISGSFVAVFLCALIATGAVVMSTPFQSLAVFLPEGWWNNPAQFFTDGFLLTIGGFILINQITAYKLRRPAGRFCVTIARHGLAQASLACLFCSIIFTPAAIYFDNKINQDLRKIALNETAYYLNR